MQKHLSFDEITAMEKRHRTNLINSSGGFKSVCLIGTISKGNITNLGVFSSIVHIGASPPLIAFIVRPGFEDRHTLTNILDTEYYTLNHMNESIFKKGHQTSASYPLEISEFDKVGLTELYKDNFLAPYVKESNVQLGIKFKEKIDLSINNTILIIGQINHLYFPQNSLCDDGFIDLEKANTVTCSGLDSYHKTVALERLSYAKPDKELQNIACNYVDLSNM